ncbi:MAG TPA: hypothetical protein VD793_01245 [Gemmatimonadales bacterium]|nr:hypothetical protein [Gemmatimonadales bacterium]
MGRFVKFLLIALLACAAFAAYSYAGARFAAGKLVGPNPPLTGRTMTFHARGVPELRGRPRAWVIAYSRSTLPGVGGARIYVSVTGTVLATQPADLDLRLDAWEKTRLP